MKNQLLIYVFVLFTFTSFSQTIPSYVPTNGLIGWWPFNNNANDESGNGNNGIVNGPIMSNDRFGNNNTAYQYNNGSNLICTSTSFNSPNILSYSVWFKTNSTVAGHLIGFNNGQCSHGGVWDRALWIENGKVVFYTFPGFELRHQAIINVIDNIWHHCVVTMDSTGSKIYIDGNLLSTDNSQIVGQSNIGYFRFGGLSPNGLNNSLIGNYDDIGIWNRVLTQEEISALYNSDTTCQTLVINTGILGFNPVSYNNTVIIYPNPANTQITIDCGNLANVTGWNIKITNTLGQEVFAAPMNTQQYVVQLNSWTGNGLYFVKIYDSLGNVVNTKKIILQ
ncbi:LamG-like jellyroll fold domain-containing protein [Flavobacterium sp. RSB2_4_14]|uniref:LamG-like jellyroll fold domain-containing protein n=1 Tax=Flavobacterium sp. RSB2_4_14 TaxID=3447665 RepID=UPI003F3FA745